jgi:hypothetical protein
MMEHQEAIQLKAAERYLLGELSGDLREQFEEHYFTCTDCSRDVEAGAVFVDSARQILGHEEREEHEARIARPARPESRGWLGNLLRPVFAGSALAVLLLFAVYQNTVVIPKMKSALSQANAPQVISSFSLVAENSRGGDVQTIRVRENATFGLFADIPPQKHFPFYNCAVETESGTPQFSVNVSAEQAPDDNIQFLVPPSQLKPGKYILVVRGADSDQAGKTGQLQVARYAFTLAFTN